MGGLLMVKAAAYGWLGGLIAAPFLWLPALGVSVWILVREPRSRAVRRRGPRTSRPSDLRKGHCSPNMERDATCL